MQRIEALSSEKTPEEAKDLLNAIQKKMGKVPNIFKSMANSPTVLEAFLQLSNAAEKTNLDSVLREKIALIVAQANKCNYCLSAHCAIAESMGISKNDILHARKAESEDQKTVAILKFCKAVVSKHSDVSDEDIKALKNQHVSDEEICEIFLVIMVNMFTNYFNKVMATAIDFPLTQSQEIL